MGQSWKQILYKYDGKGDAICQLVAEHGVSYESLNARNPHVPATTEDLPIAKTEWVIDATPPVIRRSYARPIIGIKTVLRRTIEIDGVKHTVLALRKGKYDTNEMAKAKLLVSREFFYETDGIPEIKLDMYLQCDPISGSFTFDWGPNYKIIASNVDLQSLIAYYQGNGWLGETPYGITINNNTLEAWGYYVSSNDWVYDFLCLSDSTNALPADIWDGRWGTEADGRIYVVNFQGYSARLLSHATLQTPLGGILALQGVSGTVMPNIPSSLSLVVEASNPIFASAPRYYKENFPVVIDLYGLMGGSLAPPASLDIEGITFNRVWDNSPFGTHYQANTNAWALLGDNNKRILPLPIVTETVPPPIGLQTSLDGLVNLDGVALKEPQAWRKHLSNGYY